MKKYAFYSKIREDTQAPNIQAGFFIPRASEFKRRSWYGMVCLENAAAKKFVEHLMRRSGEWMLCDDGGRVCPAGDFLRKMPKKFKISSLCPLIISTKGGMMINNMVLSREIEWIGYEHKRNMLQVEFIVGSIYQYENVPETVYREFLTAPSYGRFFESNIKNKYQVRKVR
ncbi:MAG: KTSC domain-containing protein [Candidatus Omnitrophota bacterium]